MRDADASRRNSGALSSPAGLDASGFRASDAMVGSEGTSAVEPVGRSVAEDDAEERARPFRRRELVLLAATALAVALFLLFETRLPPFSSAQTLSQNIVFFLLINLNIVLILLVVFLLGRNIVKLVVERRQRVLGSHLRTRLVGGFVAVAIAPAIFLFLVALGFIRTSIESWFSVQVESALEGSLDMADAYYRESMAGALHEAQMLAGRLSGPRRREAEALLVAEKQVEWNAAAISVYDSALGPVATASATGLADGFRKPPDRAFLERVRDEREVSARLDVAGGDLLRAGARIDAPDGSLRGVVIVDEVVPGSVVRRRDEIEQSFRQYKQLKLLRRPIINNYVLTLLLASLVVVFGGTWLGFTLARSITGPIQRLAEGARRVAAGNLEETIPPGGGSDELSALVADFNRMTTNLRSTREELVERSRTLEAILGDISAGVLSIDPHGCIDTVNPVARTLLGIDARVRGRPFREVFAAQRFAWVRELLLALEARSREGVLDRLPAQRFSVEYDDEGALEIVASGVVLRGASGQAIGALLFFEDVTELLAVQRMEAWREVARRIAHEIKNPLTPIQLATERLSRRYRKQIEDKPELFEELTSTIIRQVGDLRKMVDEFSSFARLPKPLFRQEDVVALTRQALFLQEVSRPDVAFEFEAGPEVDTIACDRHQFGQAMTNVLKNAIEAVDARAKDQGSAFKGKVSVTLQQSGERIEVTVADNGIGLTQDRERIVEPYVTTREKGTGLGLAIVNKIVEEHGGEMSFATNADGGASVTMSFARDPMAQRQGNQAAE